MQPRNELAAAVLPVLDDAAGADVAAEVLDVVVVAAGALDELLPHAAISRLAAAAATAAVNAEYFTSPPQDEVCRCPGETGPPPA
jgi:hypothetical protein